MNYIERVKAKPKQYLASYFCLAFAIFGSDPMPFIAAYLVILAIID